MHRIRRLITLGQAALFLSSSLSAQSPESFEVSVIRPTVAAPGAGTSFEVFEGGRVRITNEPVKLLVRTAFGLQNSQIAGGSNWLETDRYDIEAKTGRPEKPTPEQIGPRMQSLLRERFQLKFHREMRELPVYALVVAKGGPKLKSSDEGAARGISSSNGKGTSRAIGTAVSIDMLALYVGNRLGRITQDRTGLTGLYDFTLEWAPDETADSTAPSLTAALREQLGLGLESSKGRVEVLVIDHMERPSEN